MLLIFPSASSPPTADGQTNAAVFRRSSAGNVVLWAKREEPMQELATNTKPEAAAPARPELRVFRPDNPYVALGLAVNHLMTKPAFAARRFGEWSRILVGQINRKHYYFVV